MIARLRRIGRVIVLITPLALASCDSSPARIVGRSVTGPSRASVPPHPTAFITPMLVPLPIPFQTLPVIGCPTASPFGTSFSLIIDQSDGIDVFLHQVGFRFVDGAGFESPLIFSDIDLATRFGSTLVIAGSSRTFPFQPQFGCGLSSAPHLMVAQVLLLDRTGRRHERTLTAHAAPQFGR